MKSRVGVADVGVFISSDIDGATWEENAERKPPPPLLLLLLLFCGMGVVDMGASPDPLLLLVVLVLGNTEIVGLENAFCPKTEGVVPPVPVVLNADVVVAACP